MTFLSTRRGPCRLLLVLLLFVPLPVQGYVLMGAHVVDRMVETLGRANAFTATQTVTLHAAPPLPTPLQLSETVLMRRPNDFRADASGGPHERRILFAQGAALLGLDGVLQSTPPPRYTRYHDVLMIRPRQALSEYLQGLGIDLGVSSLGRWEDVYCYVVGARFPDEEAPQLWVSKETFLPFRLLLPAPALPSGSGPVEIRYRNWTFLDGAAFPMHVVCLANHQIMQEIRVDRVAIDPPLTEISFDPAAFRRELAAREATDAPQSPLPPRRILVPTVE
jgi:hypothetical protein